MDMSLKEGATPIGRRRDLTPPHRAIAALVVVGTILLVSPLPASQAQMETMMGNHMSETIGLAMDEYKAYGMSLTTTVPVTFTIRVTAGGPIDVYMMDASSYSEYKDPMAPSFGYYPAGTQENTMSFSTSFTAPRAGTYYLVVDNAPISTSGATGSSPATVDVSAQIGNPGGDVGLLIVGVVVAAALVVGALVIVLSIRRKRRRAAARPVVPPVWPMAPGYAPPATHDPSAPTQYQQLPPPPGPPGP